MLKLYCQYSLQGKGYIYCSSFQLSALKLKSGPISRTWNWSPPHCKCAIKNKYIYSWQCQHSIWHWVQVVALSGRQCGKVKCQLGGKPAAVIFHTDCMTHGKFCLCTAVGLFRQDARDHQNYVVALAATYLRIIKRTKCNSTARTMDNAQWSFVSLLCLKPFLLQGVHPRLGQLVLASLGKLAQPAWMFRGSIALEVL